MSEPTRETTYKVACPTCGVGPDDRCRTLTTRRVTDAHTARIDLYWSAVMRRV